jgi:2-polyprenyl-3-methyl-5-hydroxy-6-metoxy-1,4-benzoquinol methylase
LLENQTLKEKIHQANIEVHRSEAEYYELIHPEVYSKREQKRIKTLLQRIAKQIVDNQKNALDVGAGTGNLLTRQLKT